MGNKIESLEDLRIEKARIRAELSYRETLYKIKYDNVVSVIEKPQRAITLAASSNNSALRKTANFIFGVMRTVDVVTLFINKIKDRNNRSEQESD